MREPRSADYFVSKWAQIDEQLDDLDIDVLKDAEFVAARLYTGPLCPVQCVLRGIGERANRRGRRRPRWVYGE